MRKKRVLAAMSGGVDSSVMAALLAEQGYEVIGATMRLWEEGDDAPAEHKTTRTCCALTDVNDAKRVADILGIPHYTLNLKERFRTDVVDNFISEYAAGRTPNPCINCNFSLKFDALLEKAHMIECDYIATGHYARIEQADGVWRLRKAADAAKDQSYVLYHLNQETLPQVLFPLGGMENKDETRRLAAAYGLPVAQKKESQDICFIPDNDHKAFLLRQAAHLYRPGEVVYMDGRVIGRHDGIAFHTIGQRRGLGIAWSEPLFVIALDAAKNQVIVGPASAVFSERLQAEAVRFTGPAPAVGDSWSVKARIRYSHKEAPAVLTRTGETSAVLVFEQAQRAVTPGQAVVFYDGEYVTGGGIITSAR